MTTPEFTSNRDNFCYRHPDRQSFVLCQRCMRTICPECQTQAAVGVICPECMKAERSNRTPAQKRAQRQWGRGARSRGSIATVQSGRPLMTYGIIAVTAFVGLLQLVPGLNITGLFEFWVGYLFPELSGAPFQPWRLITAALVHSGIWHIGLNMLALWMIGRSLEPMLGRWRFLALYVLGGIGGSVAVGILSPGSATVGASGAVFSLFGALLVIGLHLGANMTGLFVLLGINLVIGFIPGFNIAWQAHVGGAVVGALVGLIVLRTRKREQRVWQILLLIALAAVLLVAVFVIPPLLVGAV
ncbi:rhomboid family intramembrane serine protease [Microbacterium murale]|uniref:Membrane associated rhomboid family serine protease n=1 Tax=Microbacterium murale TaxID=1081040 RepID=A0ABU0PA60_9MICO|nr:rhomboid family intramembrane serine protease [Microbacterium murale]MDQ0643571.1 membrane associated rhomboid family serine protease [Microbacterium murale]